MAAQTGEMDTGKYVPIGTIHLDSSNLLLGMQPYLQLVKQEWIRIQQVPSPDYTFSNLRIYVLPDDLDNHLVDRSHPSLRKKRLQLLNSLDFSNDAWEGRLRHHSHQSFPSLSPAAKASTADNQPRNDSLLEIFNSIPSPAPDVTTINEPLPLSFMSDLIAGTVNGITTELHPHQCRSAALMHQRETVPAKYLDPRLVPVLDQNQQVYYYDSITGEMRRYPRYYDASPGGILAEEMGAGKTLICLALIAATRDQPAEVPDIYQGDNITVRPRIGSLMDMAAAAATKHACPWRSYLDSAYQHCIKALQRNPGWYYMPRPQSRRPSRTQNDQSPDKIYLSQATLVVVPSNLLQQWRREISIHTQGLKVHISKTTAKRNLARQRSEEDLVSYDIILCSATTLEVLWQNARRQEPDGSYTLDCALGRVRYKRCIVDEGHKLGTSGLSGAKTSLLMALNSLHTEARWIVTGTPSRGLFGVEKGSEDARIVAASSETQERQDLEHIGSMVTLFLKTRPWSNRCHEDGDTPAQWRTYMMQPTRSQQSAASKDCLRSTLNSSIIRHQLSEVVHLLPDIEVKVTRLEGSYQDKLALNLFSMVIICNAVQSQRTDRDYLFHPRNHRNLLLLVNNLQQANFFGGLFFSRHDIDLVVETAEEWLEDKEVIIDAADEELLRSAIAFGKVAGQNVIKHAANRYHELPLFVEHFPGNAAFDWRMAANGKGNANLLCTHSQAMVTAQKLLRPFLDSPVNLNTYLNSGAFHSEGRTQREEDESRGTEESGNNVRITLTGNTTMEGHVANRKHKIQATDGSMLTPPHTPEESVEIAAPLANTQLISTTSAKLSYLIDAIVKYHKEEQIIVFYEHDNVAWYIAGILEMLQVQHLFYSKTITSARRAQYISTFNHTDKFRVLLMEISQAAYGLDMRSASRIYFVSPILNPQVQAQAIGRVRRISQRKKVTVETLVLEDSLEEVIVQRQPSISEAGHRKCKSILDDRPIYEWILNSRIQPLPDVDNDDGPSQMAPLAVPQYIFGREFGRERSHPDEDILLRDPATDAANAANKGKQPVCNDKSSRAGRPVPRHPKFSRVHTARFGSSGRNSAEPSAAKRARFAEEASESSGAMAMLISGGAELPSDRLAKRARFMNDDEE